MFDSVDPENLNDNHDGEPDEGHLDDDDDEEEEPNEGHPEEEAEEEGVEVEADNGVAAKVEQLAPKQPPE